MGQVTPVELAGVSSFSKLVDLLRDKLEWPIGDEYGFDDIIYEYDADDLGLKEEEVAKIREIRQLRPLVTDQPWGIFFISFENKNISVTVLRRMLRGLVVRKRAGAQTPDRQSWQLHDLIFVTSFGRSGEREIAFAHFSDASDTGDLPVLNVLGWNGRDTKLHNQYVAEMLNKRLHWPDDPTDIKSWREDWGTAFEIRHGEVISTARDLAIRLALLASNIRARANQLLEAESESGPMRQLLDAFRKNLIHDLDDDGFADMFAQTISYGLLAAKISRPGADLVADNLAHMVPKTNPFLRELFASFLSLGGRDERRGLDFDELGVRDVVDALNHVNMAAVLNDFGNRNPKKDPVIHFYEDFLSAYDKEQKVDAGIFYTPPAVVGFIVRGVDEMLRTEFGLPLGLADTTTWGEMAARDERIRTPAHVEPDQPFVQILDPATGTGTFLVEVIDLIHMRMEETWRKERKSQAEMKDLWNTYVPKHLLPRLTAFELKMAPYAIAHMKVGLKLVETGYRFGSDERLHVLLTNSLQPSRELDLEERMRLEALAHEAQRANEAKNRTPFTVIIGNPPYKGNSENPSRINGKLTHAGELVQRFFTVRGEPISERNPKWLNNDYVKFIAFALSQIEQTGTGVLGYITSNSWLDSPTFRGVRTEIIDGFPALRIVDLHGNINKREVAADGTRDEGVFAIEEGTNITLAATLATERTNRQVDLLGRVGTGTYDGKLAWLELHSLAGASNELHPLAPFYQLIPMRSSVGGKNPLLAEFYGFVSLQAIQPLNGVGIVTARDSFVTDFDLGGGLLNRIKRFGDDAGSDENVCQSLSIPLKKGWDYKSARKQIKLLQNRDAFVEQIAYRPFDRRVIFYHPALVWRTVEKIMRHMVGGGNVGLITTRQCKGNWDAKAVATIIGHKALNDYDVNSLFPLWLKPSAGETQRRPNVDRTHAVACGTTINLAYQDGVSRGQQQSFGADYRKEKGDQLSLLEAEWDGRGDLTNTFGPRDLFDWIYAVLHSPGYRARYAEFLKADFPRIPMPKDRATFASLVPLGQELIALHLQKPDETPVLMDPDIRFAGHGEARVEQGYPQYENGRVMINGSRWFEDVPRETWAFHVGGYQVCEKWLKDRAAKGGKNPSPGRVLTDEDILHYRRIVVALTETRRIMADIDRMIEEHGGWPGAFYLPPPPPPTIEQIIQADEGQDLEYKSTLQFDLKEGGKSKLVRKGALKTIVAFLNSGRGSLVIGVSDDKEVVGLEQDFSTMSPDKRSKEWFQQTIVNLINDQIGSEFAPSYAIRFSSHKGKLVCIVDVKGRSPKPAYLKDNEAREFYVRTSNVTKQLKSEEIANYVNTHWK